MSSIHKILYEYAIYNIGNYLLNKHNDDAAFNRFKSRQYHVFTFEDKEL
jgi:hypothetical protein